MKRAPHLVTLTGLLAILPVTRVAVADYPPREQCVVHDASPNPLVDPAGKPITTAEAWAKQREWIKGIVSYYSLGQVPAAPASVIGEVLSQKPVLGGHATYSLIRLHIGQSPAVTFDIALYVPQAAVGKVPIFVFPTFTGTPGTDKPADADKYYKPMDVEAFAWERADVLRRGYAIATYYYQDVARDRRNNRATGVYALAPDGDWGTIAAWAWGLSRVVDFLETEPFVDTARIAAVGHSRIGKTILTAAAFDERISLAAVAGSGCGGTGSFWVNGAERQGKEGLEEIIHKFPYWFGPRLPTFAHHVNQLPFDESWLMALVAPRPLLSTEALSDASCNPKASAASYAETQPVYRLLGASDNLGIHYRPGIHELNDDDWWTILDFADHHLGGKPAHADFHTLPAEAK